MYLHLGNNIIVKKRDIIGIFDMDNATRSQITRSFLKKQEKEHRIGSSTSEIPKSFILTASVPNFKVSRYSPLRHASIFKNKNAALFSPVSEETKATNNNLIIDSAKNKGTDNQNNIISYCSTKDENQCRNQLLHYSQISSVALSGRNQQPI